MADIVPERPDTADDLRLINYTIKYSLLECSSRRWVIGDRTTLPLYCRRCNVVQR